MLDPSAQLLEHTKTEAIASADAIRFLAESVGLDLKEAIGFTLDALDVVERVYFDFLSHEPEGDNLVNRGEFERQMGLFLGQVICVHWNAEWVIYDGNEIVSSPRVVRLPSGRFVDVFVLCKDLFRKKHLSGAREGKALRRFAERADQRSFD